MKLNNKIILILVLFTVVIFSLGFFKGRDNTKEGYILKNVEIYINAIEKISSKKNIYGDYNITRKGIKKDNDDEIIIKLKGIKPISGKIKIDKTSNIVSANFVLNNYYVTVKEENIFIKEISNSIYSNKIISILGDSISTYEGYSPSVNSSTYPRTNYLNDVNLTWWYRLINNFNMKLGVNESIGGSRIFNSQEYNTKSLGPDRHIASMTRLKNLDNNGIPDVIFLYGGTNDIGNLVKLEEFNNTADYITENINLTKTIYSSFTEAFVHKIRRLKYLYPNSELIVLLPIETEGYYTKEELDSYVKVMKQVCEYYNIFYIDLNLSGINESNFSIYYGDGLHPNDKGMYLMSEYISSEIKRNFYNKKIFDKYIVKAK